MLVPLTKLSPSFPLDKSDLVFSSINITTTDESPETPEKRINFPYKKYIEGDKSCSPVTVTWKSLQFKVNEGVSKTFSQCKLMLVGLQQFLSFENDLAQGRHHLLAIPTEKKLSVKLFLKCTTEK